MPCCSVCQNRYNEEDRLPLLLHCGHGFCADCMFQMFSTSPDSRLSCPRCRHVSMVGNSIQALRKNFAVLALIHSSSKTAVAASEFDCDYTDDEDDDENGDGEVNVDEESLSRRRGSRASTSGGCGPVIDVGVHKDLKLLRRIGEGRRDGVEMWTAVLCGGGSASTRCRHQVVVKKVAVGDGMDLGWVLEQLESLRRASMWCRNVCTFHGAMEMDGSLYLVMDRCYGSVQSKMQQNEGRLTLEQILRF